MDKPDAVPNAQWIQLGGVKARNGVKTIRGWVLVDDADYAELSQFNWYLGSDGYAYRNLPGPANSKRPKQAMHRRLLGMDRFDQGVMPDHINRDRLDNRRINLRIVPSQGHNLHNQTKRKGDYNSQYRGVGRYHGRGFTYWRARVMLKGKEVYSEYFPFTPEGEIEAAQAAMRARRTYMSHSAEAGMTEAEFMQALNVLAVPDAA